MNPTTRDLIFVMIVLGCALTCLAIVITRTPANAGKAAPFLVLLAVWAYLMWRRRRA